MAKKKAKTPAKKRPPRKHGAPVKLDDPGIRGRFFRYLKETGSRGKACQLTGIWYRTMLNHIDRDPEFAEELIRVEESALDDLEGVVHQGALNDPKIALSVLERKRQKVWGKTQQLKHEGQLGISMPHTVFEIVEKRTEGGEPKGK